MPASNVSSFLASNVAVTIPGDEPLTEVVDGEEIAKPIMGVDEGLIASVLSRKLGNHAEDQDLGRVVSEVLFHIDRAKSTMRRPDVAFVSYERWARDQKVTSENGWEVIPDLAVEVVSPTDRAIEVLAKVQEYLEAGVIRVWVVYPKVRQVHVFDEVTGFRGISRNGTLDGEDLLPGFRLALAEIFRDGDGG